MQRTSLLVPILFSGNCTFVFAAKGRRVRLHRFSFGAKAQILPPTTGIALRTRPCARLPSLERRSCFVHNSRSPAHFVCAHRTVSRSPARAGSGVLRSQISLKRPRGALCFRSPEMALEAPRTVDDVADNFENRREGLIMALTTGAKKQLRSLTTRPPIAGCVTFVGSMDAGKNSVGRVRGVPREQPAPSHWAVFPSLAFHDNTPHITCPISLTSRPPTISHARNQRRRGFLRGVGSRQGKSLSLRKPGWHVGSAAPCGRSASGASGAGARD